MEQPSYDATASPTYTEFEFDSNGTNGVTKNVIKFTPIANSGQPIHNLGFGIKVGDAIDDKTTINNGDRDLILATVVKATYIFTNTYPEHYVGFSGSTDGRTRLYRRLLSIHHQTLSQDFHIWGKRNNEEWEYFVPNGNYSAFMVKRR